MSVTTTRDRTEPASRSDSPPRLLYVQAPGHARPALPERLAALGIGVDIAADVAEALRLLAERPATCCLVDLASDRAALTTIRLIRARHPGLPLVGVADPGAPGRLGRSSAGRGRRPLALAARGGGTLGHPGRRERPRAGGRRRPAGRGSRPVPFAWFLRTPAMRPLFEALKAAAATRQDVAVVGEAGSGREVAARRARTGWRHARPIGSSPSTVRTSLRPIWSASCLVWAGPCRVPGRTRNPWRPARRWSRPAGEPCSCGISSTRPPACRRGWREPCATGRSSTSTTPSSRSTCDSRRPSTWPRRRRSPRGGFAAIWRIAWRCTWNCRRSPAP